jgi:cbb3-type cytochrome oxidase subunit 3|tara:strand:- start:1073 stop:1564 length:492 start_codon:yes stop_codon:yes gene_type:complete
LEELIYWGAIFLFYIFSAYRSRQKKQNSEEVFAPKPLSNQENKSKNSDFNIFEFLDEAMEKSTIDLEELPKTVNSEINTVDTLRAKSTTKQDSYSVNDIKVEKKYDFNEKHLSHLETKINLSQKKNTSTSKKLLTIQKKLQNDPTKLGIVMQAIFDPPKSQGI